LDIASMVERDVTRVVNQSGQKKLKKRRAEAHRAAEPTLKESRTKGVRGTVSEERLFRPDGHRGRVLTLDANSATFASDLTLMFEKNVERVRREHRKKSGSAGRARQRA
jgi:hypothetical protein